MNVHGSWRNHALALGLDKSATPESNSTDSSRATSAIRANFQRVTDPPPWREVVVDKDINLFELMPLFRLNRGDGGYFIDKPCVVSRDPDDWDNDDVENVGVYRLQVKGRNRLGIQTVPQHDIAIHLAHAEKERPRLAGGDHPSVTIRSSPLMAATPMLYDQLEYKMAGAVQTSHTGSSGLSSGLDVPWGSRIHPWRAESSTGNAKSRARSASFRVTTQGATSTP